MTLKFKKLHSDAIFPVRKTSGAAGYDLSALPNTYYTLSKGIPKKIPTGVAMELPPGYFGLIAPRSSLGNRAITVANSPGITDDDYRGEIWVTLISHHEDNYVIQGGDRIAQLIVVPYAQLPVEEVYELSFTTRGEGGFGSTGK